ncbi:17-beta-hydroxysteroid dehydrogenase type 3 [Chanos chanos]|uniref:17-beta-hydroxysteroid dehydrogenase type 3 n=1 Tax=Chanos chanos TaxID=29144 RepID=A0A6J2UL28_CHACN|nr:testosterone 17-beta-dehydrogenase 3 [Chanos chanos]
MEFLELLFVSAGLFAVLFYGGKIVGLVMMLWPSIWYPLPGSFFTSVGQWAVITGGSDGIGRAFALELSKKGMNVVIISRNQEKLDRAAKDIEITHGRKVKVVVADFTEDDIYQRIEKTLSSLDIGILVNNVGILPTPTPCKLLETTHLEQRIQQVINCNVKAMVKMCSIVLPGMEKRGRGCILNISSGIAKIPCPTYTLYAASKVFVEMLSQGLQAEYRSKGIIVQSVAPFGVSTAMTGYQKPDMVTLSPKEFVRTSLMYVKAGDLSHGTISHTILGWIVQAIPTWVLQTEAFQCNFMEFVKQKVDP